MGALDDATSRSSSPGSPRLLSLPEAAAVLRISLRSLRTLVALGKLPTVRPTARRVLVAESDLAAYIASRRSS